MDVWIYLYKAAIYVKPLWAFFTSILYYVLFPDETFIPATIALISVLVIDILAKYYSIGVLNGGIINSIRTGKITSESLWRGTKRKIISILIVMILCGLSYRLTDFTIVSTIFQTFCFSILFWREAQSTIENLLDAGHDDLKWMLFFIKKKKKEVMDANGINESDDNH